MCFVKSIEILQENKLPCVPAGPQRSEGFISDHNQLGPKSGHVQ